jgi:hypothetical protein
MALAAWLGPRDRWPRHPHLNHVIAMVRRRGWWLRPSTEGAIWGKITCKEPTGDQCPGDDSCVVSIRRNPPASPEEQVRRIGWALSECTHDDPDILHEQPDRAE